MHIYMYVLYRCIIYRHCNIELEFDCLRFSFQVLYSATNLRVWKHVLCVHMTSFKYGQKRVRDVDPNCRCNQSHYMSDCVFIINIAQ